jgi:hypothetical protein
MPITTQWLVEGHVVHVRSVGHINMDEFKESVAQVEAYIDSSDRLFVHVLMDDQDLESMPQSALQLSKAVTWLKHEHLGWAITYGSQDRLIQFISNLGAQISRIRYRRLPTEAEALEFLQERDADLPLLAPLLQEHP